MIAPPPTHTSEPMVIGLPYSVVRRCSAIERMERRVDLHGGTEQGEVSDADATDVEHDAVEIEEHALAELVHLSGQHLLPLTHHVVDAITGKGPEWSE